MNPSYRICLIEDDPIVGEALLDRFDLEGYACDWFQTGRSAIAPVSSKAYDAVISDIRLPDVNGEQLFAELKQAGLTLPPFLFITGHGEIDSAVRLLKMGAADYLTKPFDVEVLLQKLREVCARTPRSAPPMLELGISAAMRRIAETLPRLASRAGTILLTGESGTGKEVVARMLHRLRDPGGVQPFIAVNCGALSETLLESELFGHEAGSFTGAVRTKKGVFELASGGMLFLDEIGEMPLPMQVRLLRALQERKIVRVGGETEIPVHLNLVCATHRDLRRMVEAGAFREDLYFRIHVIHINVPPLRERKEDILWLAQRFLDEQTGPKAARRTLHPLSEQALLDYPWPGNVRELRNCIERASIVSDHPVLSAESLFESVAAAERNGQTDNDSDSLATYVQACEKRYIERALRMNEGKIIETAAALGISRKTLWDKMRKLGLSEHGKFDDARFPARP